MAVAPATVIRADLEAHHLWSTPILHSPEVRAGARYSTLEPGGESHREPIEQVSSELAPHVLQ